MEMENIICLKFNDNSKKKKLFFLFIKKNEEKLFTQMTGSSPEIRMIGGGTHTLGRSAAALVHKHSLLANGSQKVFQYYEIILFN